MKEEEIVVGLILHLNKNVKCFTLTSKNLRKTFQFFQCSSAAVFGNNIVKLHRFFIPRFPSCNDHLKENHQKKNPPDTSVKSVLSVQSVHCHKMLNLIFSTCKRDD